MRDHIRIFLSLCPSVRPFVRASVLYNSSKTARMTGLAVLLSSSVPLWRDSLQSAHLPVGRRALFFITLKVGSFDWKRKKNFSFLHEILGKHLSRLSHFQGTNENYVLHNLHSWTRLLIILLVFWPRFLFCFIFARALTSCFSVTEFVSSSVRPADTFLSWCSCIALPFS